jgi:hypothetical protein
MADTPAPVSAEAPAPNERPPSLHCACCVASADENARLRALAEAVCWFDWSDNDEDAVQAIAALRAALQEPRT